ncbi:hypothetical protein GCM10023238_31700 [Streptomyces heliomycini]
MSPSSVPGRAGAYTAQSLVQQTPGCAWTSWTGCRVRTGLVRYGVAPDHEKIKSLQNTLRAILEHERVRFLGGVPVGPGGVPAGRLRELYPRGGVLRGAPPRTAGWASRARNCPGSWSATEFVSWYSAHPDAADDGFLRGVRSRWSSGWATSP